MEWSWQDLLAHTHSLRTQRMTSHLALHVKAPYLRMKEVNPDEWWPSKAAEIVKKQSQDKKETVKVSIRS